MAKTRVSTRSRLTSAERRNEIMRLRKEGWAFDDIAKVFGISRQAVHAHYLTALRDVPAANVKQHRALDLERVDALIKEAWRILKDPGPIVNFGKVVLNENDEPYEDPNVKLSAINTVRGLLDRRARLLGLDAPTRKVLEVITEDAVEAAIRQLEEEMADLDPADLEALEQ